MRDFASEPATLVTRMPQIGMISLRADLSDPETAQTLDACGLSVPQQRHIIQCSAGGVGWMSPDEALVLCEAAAAPELVSRLGHAFASAHALVVDVSDARARFQISGAGAREALAKLCPVDLAPGVFEPGELRRTRLAQVAAAFWMAGPESFELVCFRSISGYVEEALRTVARPGGRIGVWSGA